MMTRAQRRRLGLADAPVPCAGSGRPMKPPRLGLLHPMRPCTVARLPGEEKRNLAPHPPGPSPEEFAWRDWANLTTELIEDIAGRLLTLDVAEYLRLRAACKPWRECTDDPRAGGGCLNIRFHPHHWVVRPHYSSTSRYHLTNLSTGARFPAHLPEVSTHHRLSQVNGLLVLCDKATYAVRLFNPLIRTATEFPAITKVRAGHDAGPNGHLAMEALDGGSFPDLSVISDIASVDESTSPLTLHLYVRNGLWYIIRARPGDQHWVVMNPFELRGSRMLGDYCYINYHTVEGRRFYPEFRRLLDNPVLPSS